MNGADVVMNHAPFGVQVRLDPAARVHYIEEWRGSGAPAPDGGGGA
jgi:hypothetical protein